jgi:hypothetical protein
MYQINRIVGFVLVIVAILTIGMLPAEAQFNQDDIDQAVCVYIEIGTGPTGEYIRVFLYQDELNEG